MMARECATCVTRSPVANLVKRSRAASSHDLVCLQFTPQCHHLQPPPPEASHVTAERPPSRTCAEK
eukprot:1923924-Amphidinium_carterae.1